MKRLVLILFFLGTSFDAIYGQERLFSIGTTKNYISKDSTNFVLNVDLNRIPGIPEKAGGYFFVNEIIKGTKRWGWYFKPSIDINLGSGTTAAPNNINFGLPIGLVYDFKAPKILSFYLEASPEMVADKSFDNYLFYASVGPYIKYEYNSSFLINVTAGLTVSNGKRSYSSKSKGSNSYGRVTTPIFVKLSFWNDTVGSGPDAKGYRRISLSSGFKFNNVYNDNSTITPDPTMNYFSCKLDVYIIPRLAIGVTYNVGHEEPLFKKVNSLTIGLTLARF